MGNVEVNSHGTNKAIKAHILPDDEMRKIGFTDRNEKNWYYWKNLGNEISFNVTIPKDGSDISIDVLDEEFLQPYDFQYILKKNPDNSFATKVKAKVEDYMRLLQNQGVLSGHKQDEYI